MNESNEFTDVKVSVMDEADDMVLLEIEGQSMFIQAQEVTDEVGIAHREVTRVHYTAGYWGAGSYSMWEPPEPVEHELGGFLTLSEAVVELHAAAFRWRLEMMLEPENLFEESV